MPTRPESEMLALIVGTAREDPRIRAVLLGGSRVDPDAAPDPLRDYDVAYFVTELAPFVDDPTWIDRFGPRIICQTPEAMGDPPPTGDGHFAYLMQLADGNRIDLSLFPLAMLPDYRPESLTTALLDKDALFPDLPPPSARDFLPTPPSPAAFADCCNEFWWVGTYVAKALWRDETFHARFLLEDPVRAQLMKMLDWWVGCETGFTAGIGKHGKHLRARVPAPWWTLLERTCGDARPETAWEALEAMGTLFEAAATSVAARVGGAYPHDDAARVRAYCAHLRALPRDAETIYG